MRHASSGDKTIRSYTTSTFGSLGGGGGVFLEEIPRNTIYSKKAYRQQQLR
jgi:hypothetical protein